MAEDQRIDVAGYRLASEVAGRGSPAIVLEAGMGGASDAWDSVFASLAQITRVCRYDRAGRGRSDPAPVPRSCLAAVTDLRQLLAGLALPPPYVLVGHSFGGLLVRLFTLRYPHEVGGLVLLDAAHPDAMARYLACLPAPAADEPPALVAARSYLSGRYEDPALNPEGFQLGAIPWQTSAAGSLGDWPLVVLTAGRYEAPPGLPQTLAAPLGAVWLDLQRELARLSVHSTHIVVEDGGHHIQVEHPGLVVDAIRSVVAAIQATVPGHVR